MSVYNNGVYAVVCWGYDGSFGVRVDTLAFWPKVWTVRGYIRPITEGVRSRVKDASYCIEGLG